MISSLSFLHSPEHPKRFTELSREEEGDGEDRGDLGEKKESQKGESNQASNHTPKEKWVLRIGFLKVQN